MLTPQRETIMFYLCIENFSGFHWWTKHNASNKQRAKNSPLSVCKCMHYFGNDKIYMRIKASVAFKTEKRDGERKNSFAIS